MNWIGFTASGGYLVEYTQDEWDDLMDTSIMPYFSITNLQERLLNWRREKGYSQERAAQTLAISRNYYSQIERGKCVNYSHNIYKAIANELIRDGIGELP